MPRVVEILEQVRRLRDEVEETCNKYFREIGAHFEWLDEIAERAKEAFETSGVELLPTTPCEKRKRRVVRGSCCKATTKGRRSSSNLFNKNGRTPNMARVRAAVAATIESGIDTDHNRSSANVQKSEDEIAHAVPPAIDAEANERIHQLENGDRPPMEDAVAIGRDNDVYLVQQVRNMDIREQQPSRDVVEKYPAKQKETGAKAKARTPPRSQKPKTATAAARSKLGPAGSGIKRRFTPASVTAPRLTPSRAVKRLTPRKGENEVSAKEMHERLNMQLEEAAIKKRELLRKAVEEQKRRRELLAFKAAQARKERDSKQEELRRAVEKKFLTPSSVDVEERRLLRPRFPDSAKKTGDNERKQLPEKEKERMRHEQEETNRLAKKDSKHQKPPLGDQQKPAAAFEPNPVSIVKLSPVRGPANIAALASKARKRKLADSHPVPKPSTLTNYDISDLRSDDETDDENHPRKKIPSWATGTRLQAALKTQFYEPPDLVELFGVASTPDLTKIFKRRKRYLKRTSSAQWDSPINPHTTAPK